MKTSFVYVPLGMSLMAVALAACSSPSNTATDQKSAPASQVEATVAGQCPWVKSKAPIAQRVDQLLGRMTLDQKLKELHGGQGFNSRGYAGELPGIPSLCIPALTFQDGPGGAGDGFNDVTQLPAPVALAATWDTQLAKQYGAVVGAEQWGKGAMVDLGPTINIVRDPRWGRAFESYSEDPFLSGYIGAGYVNGVQSQGVMAEIKHWAVYNQETFRNTPLDDLQVSERALQELYFPAFRIAIERSHPASAMCSYSYFDGVAACADHDFMTKVLRNQFHFDGFVVSDWGGTHSTLASVKAGLNVEMPNGKYYGKALKEAVQSGKVSEATVDDLLRPIFTKMFEFNLFTRQPKGTKDSPVATPAHAKVATKVAEDGMVLLKNAGYVLPLSGKVHSIAVIGSGASASAITSGGGSAHVNANAVLTPLEGIIKRAGGEVSVHYAQGDVPEGLPAAIPSRYLTPESGHGHGLTRRLYNNPMRSGKPVSTQDTTKLTYNLFMKTPGAGLEARKWSAKFTGTLMPPVSGRYTFSLTSGGFGRLLIDGKTVVNRPMFALDTNAGTIELKAGQKVSIEIDYSAPMLPSLSGILQPSMRLGWKVPVSGDVWPRALALQQQAVKAAKASDVALVFVSKFETEGVDLDNIRLSDDQNHLIEAVAKANPNTIVVLNTGSAVTMPWIGKVRGVIEAWYPGQEYGKAIASILFGDTNPSGKLPVTFPVHQADVPASTQAQWPGMDGKVAYSEGLKVGYRWYDAKHVKPLFPFGYGLSYTSFKLGNIKVSPQRITSSGKVTVTVDLTNTGKRAGAEVAQLYVGHPASAGEPPKQLRAFDKVFLKPGQTRQVSLNVPARAFAVWNEGMHAWQVADGSYKIWVGNSSAHLPLEAQVRVVGGQHKH
ncbi:MAG TPA: glycoside hydrolase family 3 C-terminal domain-containing protein [Rhodanobacteraceae bacterium]